MKDRKYGFVDENNKELDQCFLTFWYPGQVRFVEIQFNFFSILGCYRKDLLVDCRFVYSSYVVCEANFVVAKGKTR